MANVKKIQSTARKLGLDPVTLLRPVRVSPAFTQEAAPVAEEPAPKMRETGVLDDFPLEIKYYVKRVALHATREQSDTIKAFRSVFGEHMPAEQATISEPQAFSFCREGMQYYVRFKNSWNDAEEIEFLISRRFAIGGKPHSDVRPMGRSEAVFAMNVISSGLTIGEHVELSKTIQSLRENMPVNDDNFIRRDELYAKAEGKRRSQFLVIDDLPYDKGSLKMSADEFVTTLVDTLFLPQKLRQP